DIKFNTGQTFSNGSTYDLFTVAVHEIGHALGLYHSGTVSAEMYSGYNGVKNALTADDVAGIRSIYSNGQARSADAYHGAAVPNSGFATAADLTPLLDPTALTAQLPNLDITTAGTQEYFSVTAPSNTSGTFAVSVQSAGLSLLAPKLTVYAADQSTVLGSA